LFLTSKSRIDIAELEEEMDRFVSDDKHKTLDQEERDKYQGNTDY